MRPKGRKGQQGLSISLQSFGNLLPIVRGALDIFLWWREDVGSLSTWRFKRRHRKPDHPPRHSLWLHLRCCSFTYELSAPACVLPTSQSYPDSHGEVVRGTQGLAAVCLGWLKATSNPEILLYRLFKKTEEHKYLYKCKGLLRAGRCDNTRHVQAPDITLIFCFICLLQRLGKPRRGFPFAFLWSMLSFSPRGQGRVDRGRFEWCLDMRQRTMHLDPPSLGEDKFCFIFLPPFGT